MYNPTNIGLILLPEKFTICPEKKQYLFFLKYDCLYLFEALQVALQTNVFGPQDFGLLLYSKSQISSNSCKLFHEKSVTSVLISSSMTLLSDTSIDFLSVEYMF